MGSFPAFFGIASYSSLAHAYAVSIDAAFTWLYLGHKGAFLQGSFVSFPVAKAEPGFYTDIGGFIIRYRPKAPDGRF